MIEVRVYGDDIEGALRHLKEKVMKSGIQKELKAHQHFIPKSERRREQVRKGIRRARRREQRTEGKTKGTI